VAQRSGKTAELDAAVQRTLTAAVRAVMAQAIEKAGWPVEGMPKDSFHLKPLVPAFGRELAKEAALNPSE
jgi:uroporphyrinogen-III synthase